MIDKATIQLNETLYHERLRVAAGVRLRRTCWIAAPRPIEQLRQIIRTCLISRGQQIPSPVAPANICR